MVERSAEIGWPESRRVVRLAGTEPILLPQQAPKRQILLLSLESTYRRVRGTRCPLHRKSIPKILTSTALVRWTGFARCTSCEMGNQWVSPFQYALPFLSKE